MLYEAVVIGASIGGLQALSAIIPKLPKDFKLPVIVVQHRGRMRDEFIVRYLNGKSDICVTEACSRGVISPEFVYISPAGYHLLVENDKIFSLSVDPPVSYSIPSVDVLFETAAEVYQEKLVGVLLTGANSDGSGGLQKIKSYGGLAIVQDPKTTEASSMVESALKLVEVDHVVALDKMGEFLRSLPYA